MNMKRHKNAGFTLIELLIAITILAILAAGLFAAIDPVEQFNRANEAGNKQVVQDIADGIERYAAAQAASTGTSALPGSQLAAAGAGSYIAAYTADDGFAIDALVKSGDLKTQWPAKAASKLSSILMFDDGTSNVYVCMRPVSKQGKNAANLYASTTDTTPASGEGTSNTLAAGMGIFNGALTAPAVVDCRAAGQANRGYCAFCAVATY